MISSRANRTLAVLAVLLGPSIVIAQVPMGDVQCACPGLSRPLGNAASCEEACFGTTESSAPQGRSAAFVEREAEAVRAAQLEAQRREEAEAAEQRRAAKFKGDKQDLLGKMRGGTSGDLGMKPMGSSSLPGLTFKPLESGVRPTYDESWCKLHRPLQPVPSILSVGNIDAMRQEKYARDKSVWEDHCGGFSLPPLPGVAPLQQPVAEVAPDRNVARVAPVPAPARVEPTSLTQALVVEQQGTLARNAASPEQAREAAGRGFDTPGPLLEVAPWPVAAPSPPTSALPVVQPLAPAAPLTAPANSPSPPKRTDGSSESLSAEARRNFDASASIPVAKQRGKGEVKISPEATQRELPEALPRATTPEPPSPYADYVASGHGLIGGGTWLYGFGKPSHCDAACLKKIKIEVMRTQRLMCSAGSAEDSAQCMKTLPFDGATYDFALSLATTPNPIRDLATRVLRDQFNEGQFSAENRAAYASLKGRKFTQLDCHSNGAMICLFALRRGDVMAREVRLLGPQLSEAAVAAWAKFSLATGTKVTVFVNAGDPVPAASYALSTGTVRVATSSIGIVSSVLMAAWADSTSGALDLPLRRPGIEIVRFESALCPKGRVSVDDCHVFGNYRDFLQTLPP